MDSQLSIIINVKNGAKGISRCLASLHKFTDIVVFDNYSTDNTLEIAREYPNVNIIEHEFCGMGKVRNMASIHAKNDWLLVVDSDEVLHPDLVNFLLSLKPVSGTIYSLLRHNFYANRWINSSAWENDWVLRLYNRRETQYNEVQVHESIMHENMLVEKINQGFIYHFPYNEVGGLIDKMQTYSSWYAKEHYPKKCPKLWLIPFRAFFMFLKCYILKRGFLDGFSGFAISSYNAMGVFSKYIKLYELYNNQVLGLTFRVDTVESMLSLCDKVNNQNLLPHYTYIMSDNNRYNDIELCVPYSTVPLISANEWKNQVSNPMKLDYLVYLEDVKLLSDQNLLKKCKKNILLKRQMPEIQLINLR
ncbi:MAG: glycosyltransferase family 2 protein [Burkholderiales bacterium]|jgi:glycosyltransferase involved in cell wall biosynthesis|nr:glycosyltransferase family 2 protein [Burkholderiales bacterium]